MYMHVYGTVSCEYPYAIHVLNQIEMEVFINVFNRYYIVLTTLSSAICFII